MRLPVAGLDALEDNRHDAKDDQESNTERESAASSGRERRVHTTIENRGSPKQVPITKILRPSNDAGPTAVPLHHGQSVRTRSHRGLLLWCHRRSLKRINACGNPLFGARVSDAIFAVHRYGRGVLLLINGAPGAGKSTLGHLYANVHPLSLVIEIDAIRTQLGGWEEHAESRQIARDLAVALARAHLGSGHVVIVPQFIGRPEFVQRLRLVAVDCGVRFVEVILTDDSEAAVQRFLLRRSEFYQSGGEHPESDLTDDAIASEIAAANDQLLRDAASRGAFVLSGSAPPEESCRSLHDLLARRQ